MLNRFLGGVGRVVGAISPIDLFQRQQFFKVLTAGHKMMAKASKSGMDAMGILGAGLGGMKKAGLTYANRNLAAVRANLQKEGTARGITDYMRGYKIGEIKADVPPGLMKFRSRVRTIGAGVAATYFGSQVAFGGDNPISNTIGFGVRATMHGAIAAGLSKYSHPYAGIAYAGLSAINIWRKGNNLGPF